MKTIAVTGATGRQGGAVIRHLQKSGAFRLRALTRNSNTEKSRSLQKLGVEVYEADMNDGQSLLRALSGVDGVFSVQNYWENGVGFEGEVLQGKNLIDAAKIAGVSSFVQSSMADGAHPIPSQLLHFRSKQLVEQYLIQSGLSWTVLGTVTFMDNFLDPKLGGRWTFPFITSVLRPESRYHMLATDDIGGIVAAIFSNVDSYVGKKINLTGDAPTIEEMRSIYLSIVGKSSRRIRFPLFLARILNKEFVEQLEWQKRGAWLFTSHEAKAIYPGMTSFSQFLLKHGIEVAPVQWTV